MSAKHLPIMGGEAAAKALSAAIWKLARPKGASNEGNITQYAVPWRETKGGWVLEFPDDYQIKIADDEASGDLLTRLAEQVVLKPERDALAADITRKKNQNVPVKDVLPESVKLRLVDTENLENAGYGPIETIALIARKLL